MLNRNTIFAYETLFLPIQWKSKLQMFILKFLFML